MSGTRGALQDVFHLSCVGLKQAPAGEWVCPGCTLASGATGSAAEAALAALQGVHSMHSRLSPGGCGWRGRSGLLRGRGKGLSCGCVEVRA